jgi:hypothetical protein
MWTRRRFGAAALGTGAVLPAAGACAPPASARAARDAAVNLGGWAVHRGQSSAQPVPIAGGVRLQAGPMGAVDRNGLAIWSPAPWAGDFRASFRTRKLDGNVGRGGESLFMLLYFGAQGDGTPSHPANMAAWPGSTVPYTHAYAEHVRGARITFYFQPPGAAGEVQPLSAAYFRADGSRNAVRGSSSTGFPGLRNVAYGWTVRRTGDAVTVTQSDGYARRSVTFASAAFGQFAGAGHFGLLVSPGRTVEVAGFTLAR